MQKDIHPTYSSDAKTTCACGVVYETGSTIEANTVELCRACHPFYTGTQKILDTARRVEKFQKRDAKKIEENRSKTQKNAERAAKRKPKFDIEESGSARIKKSK